MPSNPMYLHFLRALDERRGLLQATHDHLVHARELRSTAITLRFEVGETLWRSYRLLDQNAQLRRRSARRLASSRPGGAAKSFVQADRRGRGDVQ